MAARMIDLTGPDDDDDDDDKEEKAEAQYDEKAWTQRAEEKKSKWANAMRVMKEDLGTVTYRELREEVVNACIDARVHGAYYTAEMKTQLATAFVDAKQEVARRHWFNLLPYTESSILDSYDEFHSTIADLKDKITNSPCPIAFQSAVIVHLAILEIAQAVLEWNKPLSAARYGADIVREFATIAVTSAELQQLKL